MKKYFKSYILFALMALTFAGCKTDDLKDDLDDLKDRVTLLEEQVKILNDNLEVLAYVLNPDNKTINRVIEEEDGAFTIVLSDNQELRLEIGSQGSVSEPSITVSEDGYWVINDEKTQNKAIGKDGDNLIPEFKIEGGKWKVRFGEKGKWEDVAGDYSVSEAGDQFFESAKVEGDNFVITAKNGTTKYVMPIVAGLTCAINKENPAPTPSGYYEIKAGEKKDFDVEITGDGRLLAPIYPEGWRAELTPQTEAGKYTLTVYAPLSSTSTLSRATANNSEEVVVRANKGVFWAVDKIKVRLPKVYTSEKEKYDDGLPIEVNGFSIDPAVYGASKSLPEGNSISEGGVYFITDASQTSKTATEITLNIANGIDKLVIINESSSKSTLKIDSKQTLKGTLALNNLEVKAFDSSGATKDYVFDIEGNSNINIVLYKCVIKGLVANKGLVKSTNKGSIETFSIHSSDFVLTNMGETTANDEMNIVADVVNCKVYSFCDNIMAYNLPSPSSNKISNFKLFRNNTDGVINSLSLNNNTFINITANSSSSALGLFYLNYIGTATRKETITYKDNKGVEHTKEVDIAEGAVLEMTKNICYFTIDMEKNSFFIRHKCYQIRGEIKVEDNIAGYVKGEKESFKNFYTSVTNGQANSPEGVKNDITAKENIFEENGLEWNTFTFKPTAEFSSYGAQR